MIAGNLARSYHIAKRTSKVCERSMKMDNVLVHIDAPVRMEDKTHSLCQPEMHVKESIEAIVAQATTTFVMNWPAHGLEPPFNQGDIYIKLGWHRRDRALVMFLYMDDSMVIGIVSSDNKLRIPPAINKNSGMYRWLHRTTSEKGTCQPDLCLSSI